MTSDQTRRKKSKEVNSRYLSTTLEPPPLVLNNHNNTLSPNYRETKHKHTRFIRGIWPSSATKYNNGNQQITTATSLADHLSNETRKQAFKLSENSPVLSKQKSGSEKHSKTKNIPVFGGSSSMRFTRKLMSPGRPSVSVSVSSSTKSSDVFDSNQVIVSGRLSVDENALRQRSSYYQMKSDSLSENSESSDLSSPLTAGRKSRSSYMAPTPTWSSKKSGSTDVPSKYVSPSIPMHNSPTMKRLNSLSWSSPSRLGSPSFSNTKPPTSSSRNLLHIGLDMIKGKKGSSKLHPPLTSDTGDQSVVNQLRLLHNSWMQWRYANARAQNVHDNLAAQSENMLFCGYQSLAKLRQSVVQKRLQLQREKLQMKLNLILHSHTKLLEAWGEIERKHELNISVMKDYLHGVVCMIPLTQGAKVDLESATMAIQQPSHLLAIIKSMLSSVSLNADETMVTLSELAEVVNHEKLLLEECFEHLRIISTLEIQETNLRCSIIAMDSSDKHRQQKQQMFM